MAKAPNELILKDLLDETREVQVVSERASISDIISTIKKKHVASILVVDEDGNLSGLISEHDVVSAIADNGIEALDDPIADYMTLDLMVCTPDEKLEDAMRLMADHNIRHLPVVTESGQLIGFLTILEMLSAYQHAHMPPKSK